MNWDVVVALEVMATTTVAALAAWLSYKHVRLSQQPNIVPTLDFVDNNQIYLKLTNFGGTAIQVKVRIVHEDGPLIEQINTRCPVLRSGVDVLVAGQTLEEPIGTIDPAYFPDDASGNEQEVEDVSITFSVTIDYSLPGADQRKTRGWTLVFNRGTIVRATRKRLTI